MAATIPRLSIIWNTWTNSSIARNTADQELDCLKLTAPNVAVTKACLTQIWYLHTQLQSLRRSHSAEVGTDELLFS